MKNKQFSTQLYNISKKETPSTNYSTRNYWFDNTKFFLILFVVVGHFTQHFKETNEILNYIHNFISLFHMPLFIYINGYFSKKSTSCKSEKIVKYFILFFIMQIIEYFLGGGYFGIVSPGFTLWYLQTIIIYKLFTYILDEFKPLPIILLSIILGLFIGYDNFATTVGSISRIITMFPFFIMGYYTNENFLLGLKEKSHIILSVLILLVVAISLPNIMYGKIKMPIEIFYGKIPYADLGLGKYGFLHRLLWYILATITSISFLSIVSQKKIPIISKFGTRTLQVYCLHALIFLLFQNSKYYFNIMEMTVTKQCLILIIGSMILTLFLSLKIFSYPFDFIMNLKLGIKK